MKRTSRTVLSTLLAALALAAAAVGVSLLPQEPSAKAPAQVAQSTSAILEDRAA